MGSNLLAVVLVQVVADLLGGSKHLQELGQLIVLQAPSQLRLGTRTNLPIVSTLFILSNLYILSLLYILSILYILSNYREMFVADCCSWHCANFRHSSFSLWKPVNSGEVTN